MRTALKRLASRIDSPALTLLILDWRFSIALLLVVFTVVAGFSINLKLWRRSPLASPFEIRVSTLDLLQSRTLARAARKAERRGDFKSAIQAWYAALANDPCNEEIGASCLRALSHSHDSRDDARALQLARWFRGFSTNSDIRSLSIAAAERNKDWQGVLELSSPSQLLGTKDQISRAKALFWTGNYPAARELLASLHPDALHSGAAIYAEALNSLLPNVSSSETAFEALSGRVNRDFPSSEDLEVFLQTCYGCKNLPAFEKTLDRLKQLTDHTLPFDILHAELLRASGLRQTARRIASQFPAPISGQESFRAAHALLNLGMRSDAMQMLRAHLDLYFDSLDPWLLYAQLLLEEGDREGLRQIAHRLERSSLQLVAFTAAIDVYLAPGEQTLASLMDRLSSVPRNQYARIWYFVAQALAASGNSDVAVETLLALEPFHSGDIVFYDHLFAIAESAKDADIMLRAAKHRYELAPNDSLSIGNYAAMLAMFDEEPDVATALAAEFAESAPTSPAALLNYAAALINSERFGSAELALRKVAASSLPSSARNQLRFIKLKRAVKLGLDTEARSLAAQLDRSALYSRQRVWLAKITAH